MAISIDDAYNAWTVIFQKTLALKQPKELYDYIQLLEQYFEENLPPLDIKI
jgi:hypothetical protein